MKPTTVVQRAVLGRNIIAPLENAVAEMTGMIDLRTLNAVRDLIGPSPFVAPRA